MNGRFFGRRALAGAITVAALALTGVGAAVTAHPAAAVVGDCTTGSDWGTSRPDLASSVVSLINSHRTSMGLVALNVSPTLTNAAVWKARHMAKYSYMAHDDPAPPVARTPADRLEACGYPSRTTGWGENIAYGYSTAASVVDAWLNSPGHKANIENSSYRSTGVGAAADTSGVIYWSQEFGTYDDSGSPGGGGGGGGVSAPTVSLTSGPSSSTTATTASFGWSTSGTVSSTTCSLDGAPAVACTSPKTYSSLATGGHTFRVTVANSAGSASASYAWTVTTTPPPPPPPPPSSAPRVSFTSVASRYGTSSTATFAWVTSGTVTSTSCSLDYAAAVPCSSPWQLSGLRTGSHRFTVTVSGPGGSGSASSTWLVYR